MLVTCVYMYIHTDSIYVHTVHIYMYYMYVHVHTYVTYTYCISFISVDQYYNSNVQVRRTAQQDFNVASKVAKKLQAEETEYAKELRRRCVCVCVCMCVCVCVCVCMCVCVCVCLCVCVCPPNIRTYVLLHVKPFGWSF